MSSWSIRARLTVMIVLVTSAISALGVLFGVRVLENDVRAAAIEERREEFESINEDVFFGDDVLFSEALIAEDGFVTEIDPAEFDDDGVFEAAVFGSELAGTAAFVEQLTDFPEIAQEVGSDEGSLFVWLLPGVITSVGGGADLELFDPDEVAEPIVPVNDLFLLEERRFSFDGNEVFEEDLTLEIATEEVDGQQVAFVAEVTDELDALSAIRNTLRNVVIALTVLSGLATWFIAGRALRPVGAITSRVDEITSGTLADRVPDTGSSDEIGVLARTMNSMLSRLENADLRRRQFVSDASHELRTPVAVLRSEAEVARRAPDSTNLDDFAGVVLGESKRLEGLVEDLLALARSDESRPLTATTPLDVDEIVLEEVARTRSMPIDQRGVSAGRVVGHSDDMQRVIGHLLDNAVRHAKDRVAIGVQTTDGVVQVWVDDDGPGISESERDRIFDRFVRLDDARTRDKGGAGLGLAVVHEMVTRMVGTVRVDDSPLGGARFALEFPAADA